MYTWRAAIAAREAEILRHNKLITAYCALLRTNRSESRTNWLNKDKINRARNDYDARDVRQWRRCCIATIEKLPHAPAKATLTCASENTTHITEAPLSAELVTASAWEESGPTGFPPIVPGTADSMVCRNAHGFVCQNASATTWFSRENFAVNSIGFYEDPGTVATLPAAFNSRLTLTVTLNATLIQFLPNVLRQLPSRIKDKTNRAIYVYTLKLFIHVYIRYMPSRLQKSKFFPPFPFFRKARTQTDTYVS